MTMLRVFIDPPADPYAITHLAAAASAPIALTVLDVPMLMRAQLLVMNEPGRAGFLAPHLSGYGDFSLYVAYLSAWGAADVYALLKQARADMLRAVWTVTDCPGTFLFRNRYCDRLTLGVVNGVALSELQSLRWAGAADNIGTLPHPLPVEA